MNALRREQDKLVVRRTATGANFALMCSSHARACHCAVLSKHSCSSFNIAIYTFLPHILHMWRGGVMKTGGNPLRDAVPEAAAAALDAVCAQLDYVRALRECQSAQIHLDIARHNLVRPSC